MLRFLAASVLGLSAALAGVVPAHAGLPKPDPTADPVILVNEVANGGPRSDADTFLELRNWGSESVDLTGWKVFRCQFQGLRANAGRWEGDLTGIELAPGEIVTISRIGLPGRLHVSSPLDETGFGVYLEDPEGDPVDLVGVYPREPFPVDSECTPRGGNLPNTLDFAAGESWQRVAATGDPARDWIAAPATIDAPNATRGPAESPAEVSISELAGMGPGGAADEFVEIRNDGAEPVALGGWQLFRCTGTGRVRPDTVQYRWPDGATLAPGARLVIGGPGFVGADVTAAHELADVEFGALLRDADGALVDRVAVAGIRDSACQGPKLPAVLDPVAGESYQSSAAGWVRAPRTPGEPNATRDDAVFDEPFAYAAEPGVAISEVANDPTPEGMPTGTVQRNWIELANYGDRPVDIGGWTLRRCTVDGFRAVDPQVEIPRGTVLAPGGTFLAARAGTEAAATADARFDVSLNLLGTGVWLADADGHRVDSVGIYAASVFDAENVTVSPCTKGLALAVHLPDRLLAETFQRTRFTGVDADDFVAAPATPGTLDLVPWVDPTARIPMEPDAVASVPPAAEAVPDGASLRVVAAWAGSTEDGPLTAASAPGERALDPAALGEIRDSGFGFPYQRLEVEAAGLGEGSRVSWTGTGSAAGEIALSVWTGSGWRLLDSGSGERLTLSGDLAAGEVRDGRVTLLVQDGPRATPRPADEIDGRLADPSEYDLAVAHLTDTQYLTEAYPDVYARMVSWIAANAETRKIAFATHTGDIVENWVDPEQTPERAIREFEAGSAIQAILDDAGVPNSVLPGNHDSKRGADLELFNTYFGPDRYADQPWYGGSIGPDDNSANYSIVEAAGARFLMLSLPYAYGDAEIAWAREVVRAHPDHNVILSTHEHVMPVTVDGPAHRAGSNRWTSRGDDLWEQVIAPHRNVVVVLSGHFHGLGKLESEDAGGIPGHRVVEILADYQEYRTHTGERATGFQRMLQIDLASGAIAVDTFSLRLDAAWGAEYDYRQFVPDTGSPMTPSNVRPWRVVASGLQGRYTAEDDEFLTRVRFQYDKAVGTTAITAAPTSALDRAAPTRGAERPRL